MRDKSSRINILNIKESWKNVYIFCRKINDICFWQLKLYTKITITHMFCIDCKEKLIDLMNHLKITIIVIIQFISYFIMITNSDNNIFFLCRTAFDNYQISHRRFPDYIFFLTYLDFDRSIYDLKSSVRLEVFLIVIEQLNSIASV